MMPLDNTSRHRITSDEIKELESKSAEESDLNDVLVLFLEAATTQLTSGHTLRAVRMETTPSFIFHNQPQYI